MLQYMAKARDYLPFKSLYATHMVIARKKIGEIWLWVNYNKLKFNSG